MIKFLNKKISSKIAFFIIITLFVLLSIFTIRACDSLKIILEYLTPLLNEKHLYTFFGMVFGGFIPFFTFLGFIIGDKTKYLVQNILFNPHYVDLSPKSEKEYELWMYVQTFNPEILRFFSWEKMKKLIKDALYIDKNRKKLNYEGENYKNAFYRFNNIIENFIIFFWITIPLFFISLISVTLIPLLYIYWIKLIIGLFLIIVFFLSLYSLIFTTLIVKSLFIAPKKEIENFKI